MVLDGSLVRSAGGVELSATLRSVAGSGAAVRGSAAGSLDSLPVLVDRLAAQLLAGRAGELTMLGELSTTRAITEYLQGKTAMRQGRYGEAKAHYTAALREDSTFALAAVELLAAGNRPQDQEAIALGERLSLGLSRQAHSGRPAAAHGVAGAQVSRAVEHDRADRGLAGGGGRGARPAGGLVRAGRPPAPLTVGPTTCPTRSSRPGPASAVRSSWTPRGCCRSTI